MVEEEGLFKKRINQIDFPCYEWSEDDSPEKIKEELCATIEEAKKTCPLDDFEYKQPNNLTLSQLQSVYDKWGHMLAEIAMWKIKWFGS